MLAFTREGPTHEAHLLRHCPHPPHSPHLRSRQTTPPSAAKIQQLLIVIHVDRNLQQAVDVLLQQVNDMSRKQLPGTEVTDAQQKKLADFQQKIFQLVTSELNWAKFEPEYIKIYDAYTEEEIDGILAFYKSPAGVAMLAKSPAITAKTVQLSQERLKLVQPQMTQLMSDFKKDVTSSAP